MSLNEGTLSMLVWPAYVGVSAGAPTQGLHWEPTNIYYQRGQITWELEHDQIIGRAKIHAPTGDYTHLIYFHHPEDPQSCGSIQLPHPIRFTKPGVIDVYPITNHDLELLRNYNQ